MQPLNKTHLREIEKPPHSPHLPPRRPEFSSPATAAAAVLTIRPTPGREGGAPYRHGISQPCSAARPISSSSFSSIHGLIRERGAKYFVLCGAPLIVAVMSRSGAMDLASGLGGKITKDEVKSAVDEYEKYHGYYGGKEEARKSNYTDMVNKYYDLATSFYEYGWGESFHFAHRWNGESLRESIKRHEHFLALQLGLKPGMKVLDVGCGIGGPLREIAKFSLTSVTGLNNNEYQITRGKELNRVAGVSGTCDFVKADFMKMPFSDNTFDAVYAIEATCHAPDPVGCYKEIYRVLKPGQCFAVYEWCITDHYDPNNATHKRIKDEVELGNGLPDIRSTRQCLQAAKDAGFEVIWDKDLAEDSPVPWYLPLDPSRFSLSSFRLTTVGRAITRTMVKTLEYVGLAPQGSERVSNFLEKAAEGLVEGGKKEIFTPMYFFLRDKARSLKETLWRSKKHPMKLRNLKSSYAYEEKC
uniref:Methyltransferase n=10 Tax=Oryza TaxID=4527 RepID=A0A0E0LIC8_ORYPU